MTVNKVQVTPEQYQLMLDLKKAEHDLAFFAERFISKNITYNAIPEFHKDIYSLVTKTKDGYKLIVAPRGHAKSTAICIIFVIWCTMFEHKNCISIIGSSKELAEGWIRKVRLELDHNPIYTEIMWDWKTDKTRQDYIEIKSLKGGIVEIKAVGASGKIRGRRPDLAIMDDIEDDEAVQSKEQRTKLRAWLDKAVIGTLLPKGQLVCIGTILHHDGLLQNILDNPIGWETLFFQAYIGGTEDEDHVLWKEQFSHEDLQGKKKVMGSWAFSSEYMNIPVSSDDAPFKPENIRRFKTKPDKFSVVFVADPAYTEGNQSDYKAGAIIGKDTDNNRYLLDILLTRLPQADYLQACLNMILKWKYALSNVGLPSGREVDFYNKFIEFCSSKGHYFSYKELKNTTGTSTHLSHKTKTARIVSSLQGLFQQGKYYIPHKDSDCWSPAVELARDQLETFPRAKYDDAPDVMSYAEQILQPVYFGKDDEEYLEECNIMDNNHGYTGYGD